MNRTLLLCLAFPALLSCHSSSNKSKDSISTDTAAISAGKALFEKNCLSCHSFEQDGIGPALGGITTHTPTDWIKNFIKNPLAIMQSDDTIAAQLRIRYKSVMPSFPHFSYDELTSIVAYLHTHTALPEERKYVEGAIRDPIPEKIPLSKLVVNIKEISHFQV